MLRISHDNKGASAGWFLDDVTVDIPSRGDQVVFPCHRWLADDEDDGKIERELYPGQQTHTNPSNYCFTVVSFYRLRARERAKYASVLHCTIPV